MIANWAGNVRFQPRRLHRPRSMEELRRALQGSDRVRVVGSAHSFNRVADTEGVLIDLAEMPRGLDVDSAGRRARVSGGWTYGELCPRLHAAGWALENLASLPHISVPGACATATHGSGRRLGCLAAQIDEVELLTADAELVTVASDDDRFPAAAVSLGALGVVTGLTLRLRPAFSMIQHVHERIPLDMIAADLEATMTRAYSVCLFTAWEDRPHADVLGQASGRGRRRGHRPGRSHQTGAAVDRDPRGGRRPALAEPVPRPRLAGHSLLLGQRLAGRARRSAAGRGSARALRRPAALGKALHLFAGVPGAGLRSVHAAFPRRFRSARSTRPVSQRLPGSPGIRHVSGPCLACSRPTYRPTPGRHSQRTGSSEPVDGVVYRTEAPPCCGVPLGGVGTGCIDLDARGVVRAVLTARPRFPAGCATA